MFPITVSDDDHPIIPSGYRGTRPGRVVNAAVASPGSLRVGHHDPGPIMPPGRESVTEAEEQLEKPEKKTDKRKSKPVCF